MLFSPKKLISVVLCVAAVLTMNGQLTVTLSTSNYNGYHVSCFGAKDGSITVNVTGGQMPYSYLWSTRDSTSSISGLASGYYSVTVKDALGETVKEEITLQYPDELKVTLEPFKYANGYNISCNQCYNGYIDVEVQGGVAPYSYLWSDGSTIADRSGLGATEYDLKTTDANGCVSKGVRTSLREPQRTDWTMNGNSGTTPAWHFLGTSDAQDVVFKTNGQERFRLKSDGEFKLTGNLGSAGLLYRDSTGILKIFDGIADALPSSPCAAQMWPMWGTSGNNATTCDGCGGFLGTRDNCALNLGTNNTTRFRLLNSGEVLFGVDLMTQPINNPQARVSIKHGWGNWLALHNQSDAGFWAFHNPSTQDQLQLISSGPNGSATPLTVYNTGKVAIGNSTFHEDGKVTIGANVQASTNHSYGLYVHDGILTERMKVALRDGEWSDFVFEPDYPLMSLADIEQFILENGHLPEVPSECELVETGIDVAKMNALLLQKIEELTLHLISLEKELNEMKKR